MSQSSKKTILMLGGSAQQVVAIKKARELGYRTVVCDYLPDNPGQYEADVFYLESTTDREKMLEIARKEHVSGVLAYSSDPASPTAAYVATKLGLPTNPPEAITTMSFKNLFRAHLLEHGFPSPRVASFSANLSPDAVLELISDFTWPIVVKPTDSSGSKGVTVISGREDLSSALQHARNFNRNGTLIAEEYIQATFPHVIGGDIFVVDGEVRFWGLMSCLRDKAYGLVPCGEMSPTGLNADQTAKVKQVLSCLVSTLGVRFGELNVEVLIGEDDTPYVLELASRAGGNMIPVQLSDVSGIDLVAANVLCAMGEKPSRLEFDTVGSPPYLTYVLHATHGGILKGIECSSLAKKATYRSVPYINVGRHVEAFDGANKALGILFMRFENLADMERFSSDPSSHVKVLVEAA